MESRAKKQHRRTFQGCKKVRVDILEIKKGVMMKKEYSKLTGKDMETLSMLLDKASRKDLDEVQEQVNHEIHLSDVAISEGYEKDDRKLRKVL